MIKDIKASLVQVKYSSVAVEKRITLQLTRTSCFCVFLQILINISFEQICWYHFYANRTFIVSFLFILLVNCKLFQGILGVRSMLILATRWLIKINFCSLTRRFLIKLTNPFFDLVWLYVLRGITLISFLTHIYLINNNVSTKIQIIQFNWV